MKFAGASPVTGHVFEGEIPRRNERRRKGVRTARTERKERSKTRRTMACSDNRRTVLTSVNL